MNIDGQDLFNTVHPGFFEKAYIRALPVEEVYEEQILDLHTFSPASLVISCPDHIVFGVYKGDMDVLHAAVRSVVPDWVSNYTTDQEIYCAFDGERIVSFCLLDDFGAYKGLRIGAPGCVGTIPEYRKRGIGLKMVQNATAIFKARGYDISYIHHTGVGRWYTRLGYKTILAWNSQGIIE